MCVDGRVSRGSREILVLSVRDVLVAAGVAVLLGQTKVDDVDQVALLPQAPVDIDKGVYILVHIMLKVTCNSHEEVVWLDVSVDEILRVDVLDPGYQLVCQEEHCLQAEASAMTIGVIIDHIAQPLHQEYHCCHPLHTFLSISPGAEVEQILQARSEQLHDHDVEVALRPTPLDGRNAHTALHDAVELGLDVELGVLRLDALELDGD